MKKRILYVIEKSDEFPVHDFFKMIMMAYQRTSSSVAPLNAPGVTFASSLHTGFTYKMLQAARAEIRIIEIEDEMRASLLGYFKQLESLIFVRKEITTKQ